ncbi:hypothetical protein ABIA16_004985 [Sinorhizobium fredii]
MKTRNKILSEHPGAADGNWVVGGHPALNQQMGVDHQ